jgi:hypothetical protein
MTTPRYVDAVLWFILAGLFTFCGSITASLSLRDESLPLLLRPLPMLGYFALIVWAARLHLARRSWGAHSVLLLGNFALLATLSLVLLAIKIPPTASSIFWGILLGGGYTALLAILLRRASREKKQATRIGVLLLIIVMSFGNLLLSGHAHEARRTERMSAPPPDLSETWRD